MDIPIGQIIREEVDRQGMTIDEFAKRISTSRTNAYDIFNRLSIDMELLERISKVLHRNFFAEMAQQMKLQLEMSPEKATMANAKLESLVHPLEKELDGTVYSEATFAKDREGLKALLKEYFESDHRIPLIILETGYTFGAREVVKQVAGEVYHSAGSAPCPKVLDASRVKSMPAKVFVEYIDCNTFDSVEVSDERLNEICRIQGDVNKKFVCIIHTDPIVSLPGKGATKSFDQWGSEMSIFLSRSEQFFISVYRWNRNSLLSWATDAGLHEYVINYIRKHQIPDGVRKDYQLENVHVSFFETLMGLPPLHHGIDYPTPQAYLQSEWQYASDFITNQGDLTQELHLRHFILDIIAFNEPEAAKYLPAYQTPMKTIECNIEVDGFMVDCEKIKLTADEFGTLIYLYHLARTTDLKMLDDESFETLFFEWLEDHHPLVAQALIRAAEDRLVELLAEDFDGYYRDNIPHEAPYSIDIYWTIQSGLKYNIMPYNLPKWK